MEYITLGQVSEKTDTFAFSVVLLEMLTGKAPADLEEFDLPGTIGSAWLDDPNLRCRDFTDPCAQWPLERAVQLAKIASRCNKMSARDRCTVKEVLSELDFLADRPVMRRAGRGEEYDEQTGKLVNKK